MTGEQYIGAVHTWAICLQGRRLDPVGGLKPLDVLGKRGRALQTSLAERLICAGGWGVGSGVYAGVWGLRWAVEMDKVGASVANSFQMFELAFAGGTIV